MNVLHSQYMQSMETSRADRESCVISFSSFQLQGSAIFIYPNDQNQHILGISCLNSFHFKNNISAKVSKLSTADFLHCISNMDTDCN